MYEGFTIVHNPSGQQFWVANGGFFFDGYQPKAIQKSIGLIERHWLYFKSRYIRARFTRKPVDEVVRRFSEAVR